MEVTSDVSENPHIDVDMDVFKWTVNCLHYLNYEAISCSSSIFHLFLQGTSSGQTVSSYGWCDGIPLVTPLFSFLENIFTYDHLSYRW